MTSFTIEWGDPTKDIEQIWKCEVKGRIITWWVVIEDDNLGYGGGSCREKVAGFLEKGPQAEYLGVPVADLLTKSQEQELRVRLM